MASAHHDIEATPVMEDPEKPAPVGLDLPAGNPSRASEATSPAKPQEHGDTLKATSPTADEKPQLSSAGTNPLADEKAQPSSAGTNPLADEKAQPSSAGTGSQYVPPSHERPESVLVSPLSHPNGVAIFPTLSTSEQQVLSIDALTQAEDNILADSDESFVDTASDGGYESDSVSTASTSASSSIRHYMYENGRRYHKFREGSYNFPNEDVEQEREDMKHAMMKLLCTQKLFFAPIGDNPQEILDMGTGTGIWAIEVGEEYPSARVLGIDLSPIQPDWVPPNVRFQVDDVESPWLHPRNHFNYIHSRHTVMAIRNWDRLFRRAIEHLKVGGWMELQEVLHKPFTMRGDGNVDPNHPVAKYWALINEGLTNLGINFHASGGGLLAGKMSVAGFNKITERVLHIPIGTWPKNKLLKTVGLYWRTILLDGLQAIAMGPLTRGLGWSRDEVEVFLIDVRRAYMDNAALMYMPLHILYAQKPE